MAGLILLSLAYDLGWRGYGWRSHLGVGARRLFGGGKPYSLKFSLDR